MFSSIEGTSDLEKLWNKSSQKSSYLPISSGLVEPIHALSELAGQQISILVDIHRIGDLSVQVTLVVLSDLMLVVSEDLEAQLLLVLVLVLLLVRQL